MPLDFPNTPTVDDVYTFGTQSWKWDGTVWGLLTDSGVPWATNAQMIAGISTSLYANPVNVKAVLDPLRLEIDALQLGGRIEYSFADEAIESTSQAALFDFPTVRGTVGANVLGVGDLLQLIGSYSDFNDSGADVTEIHKFKINSTAVNTQGTGVVQADMASGAFTVYNVDILIMIVTSTTFKVRGNIMASQSQPSITGMNITNNNRTITFRGAGTIDRTIANTFAFTTNFSVTHANTELLITSRSLFLNKA